MVEITVLLPIYNGAAYLEETLQSLKKQSFADFEVLCIDDCSSDESAQIVHRYATEDSRFIYLNTGVNLGSAPKAINHAAPKASGQRFVYSSQDDIFSEDWLEKLHARALATGADAVLPDVIFYHANGIKDRKIIGYHNDRSAIISGKEAFVASLDWSISGNALWPMSFLKNRGFEDFGAFADEYTVRRFFLDCSKVAFCDAVFYYRQDNTGAITKRPSATLLDIPDTSLRLWHLIMENQLDAEVHGPFALRTLRATIRAKALIFNNAFLTGEAHRVDMTWLSMRSSAPFQASVASLLTTPKYRLRASIYRPAARSRTWFLALARISAFLARRKGAK
jgi:glycosyltransferase involved in cell wall biosynthesis